MRVSKEKAAEHRQQILTEAARLFRKHGLGATGVDAITRNAGLTHGAVYSRFGSKEAIAIEAIRLALRDSRKSWLRSMERRGSKTILASIADSYLSERHRDAPEQGCLVAALAGDISREDKPIRDAFTKEFEDALKFLSALVGSDDSSMSEDDVLAAFCLMAGAMIVSRAVSDDALSTRILRVARERIAGRA
ncbi:MAG TPA: helix-turn-helix domain-containing protein [Candidatus Binataceae bacterium]|nr:helix-turn-helix domain-containing protein [Candidatus Binataceae bacterium]